MRLKQAEPLLRDGDVIFIRISTSLEKFVGRSEHGRFLVRHSRDPLTANEVARMRESIATHMNKLYHLGFNYDSPRTPGHPPGSGARGSSASSPGSAGASRPPAS